MSAEKNWQFELEEYIKQGEPGQIEKSEAWQTAIGLQAVDGLKTSAYLLDTAKEHLGTEYELKNRYMHVDYADSHSQSVNPKVPKSHFDTLECTLEELAVLELIYKNPSIKQKELAAETEKSLSTIKRIMESLQKKGIYP